MALAGASQHGHHWAVAHVSASFKVGKEPIAPNVVGLIATTRTHEPIAVVSVQA